MVCGLWIAILMGVYGELPGAGLTALLQDRKEIKMSKEEDKNDMSKSVNGISSDDITVTVNGLDAKLVEDAWVTHNNLVTGSYSTDTITVTPGSHGDYSTAPITLDGVDLNTDMSSAVTLNEIMFDDFNGGKTVTVSAQGDLFNGWPEDGEPDPTLTIKTLKE